MPTDEKMNFLLIGGGVRCGNSLLNRLIDGHDSVWTYPFEFKFSCRKFCHPWFPALPELDPKRFSSTELVRLMELNHLIRLTPEGYIQKTGCETARLMIDNVALCQNILNQLEQGLTNTRDVYNTLHSAFFMQTEEQAKHARWVCGSLPNACLSAAEDFFSIYPDGVFVQIVREPFGWTASMKSWAERNGRGRVFSAKRALRLWDQLHLRARIGQMLWPEQYRIIEHRELVLSPGETVRKLMKSLGLEMQDVCMMPTCMGTPWGGNTFGKVTASTGVEPAVLTRWRSVLSVAEQRLCEQAAATAATLNGRIEAVTSGATVNLWSHTAAVYRDIYGWRPRRFWRLISRRLFQSL